MGRTVTRYAGDKYQHPQTTIHGTMAMFILMRSLNGAFVPFNIDTVLFFNPVKMRCDEWVYAMMSVCACVCVSAQFMHNPPADGMKRAKRAIRYALTHKQRGIGYWRNPGTQPLALKLGRGSQTTRKKLHFLLIIQGT